MTKEFNRQAFAKAARLTLTESGLDKVSIKVILALILFTLNPPPPLRAKKPRKKRAAR
jgi:hypothetical protein